MSWHAVVLWDDRGGASATLIDLQDDDLPAELIDLLRDETRKHVTVSATGRSNALRRLAASLDAEELMAGAREKLDRLMETGSTDAPPVAAE